jgi:crotonobetainyl-CoA:carnitine CoA-transferase CaiB-like acyl-CoA transferase
MAACGLMAASTGRALRRTGNRHPSHAPHGIFRCAGTDAWIAVACTDGGMRTRLADLIGEPTETALEAWTARHTPAEAMAILQAAGIAAGAALPPLALFDDPHLAARGFWQRLDRPFIGPFPQSSLPFREGPTPYGVAIPAPTLGQHTKDVLRDLLGYSEQTLAGLEASAIIGTEVRPGRG